MSRTTAASRQSTAVDHVRRTHTSAAGCLILLYHRANEAVRDEYVREDGSFTGAPKQTGKSTP